MNRTDRNRVTLADLAKKAGVSQATVSRVLNGKGSIAEDTRKGVFAAINELGYRRPPGSQPHSEGLVGVIMQDLGDPVYPLYLQSIEMALSRHGFASLVFSQEFTGAAEGEHIQQLLDYGVAAAIFVEGQHGDTTADKSEYTRLHKAGIALVLINGYSPDIQASFLSTDNDTAMRMALDHLTSLGHRRIGLATGPGRYEDVRRKKQAFSTHMREHGLGNGTLIASSLSTVEGGQSAVSNLLAQGVSAVICSNAQIALGGLLAAQAKHLRIPDQLSLVCFDDFAAAPFLSPALTTVRQPISLMGEAAVSAFINQLDSTDGLRRAERAQTQPIKQTDSVKGAAARAETDLESQPDEILFQSSLIVRGSTGPAPVNRPTAPSRRP